MDIEITPRPPLEKLEAQLSNLEREQLPFAMVTTINQVAGEVQAAIRAEMSKVFDRPTPTTLNSLKVWKANKRTLTGRVFVRDEASKGTPPVRYLVPQVEGGQRRVKRFERSILRVSSMSGGFFSFGHAAPLNRYGNLTAGKIVQILTVLRAHGEQGYAANESKRSLARKSTKGRTPARYFLGRPGGGLLPYGVWQRTKDGVKPILIWQHAVTYRPRLNMHARAEALVSTRFPVIFAERMKFAVATARARW